MCRAETIEQGAELEPQRADQASIDLKVPSTPATLAVASRSRPMALALVASTDGGGQPQQRCWKLARRREWFELVSTAEEEVARENLFGEVDWWYTPLLKVPTIRHTWGETQAEVRSGAQELFLDLIFVGVGYRVGNVLMASYYSCAQGISAPAHARRELAALDGGECIGVGLGLLHGLAPFLCMCTLWCVETQFKARYSCASKLHTALDQLNNLLLVVAAMGVSPTYTALVVPTANRCVLAQQRSH
jgi:hypothetical protein